MKLSKAFIKLAGTTLAAAPLAIAVNSAAPPLGPLGFLSIQKQGTNVIITATNVAPILPYVLEATGNPGSTNWSSIATNASFTATLRFTNSAANSTQFFRLRQNF